MSRKAQALRELLASLKSSERERLVRALAEVLVEEIREERRLAEIRRLDR